MSKLTIKANHPARKIISDLPNYFDSKTDAVCAIENVLNLHGMKLEIDATTGFPGDEGSTTFGIVPVDDNRTLCDKCAACIEVDGYNNLVSFSWYRMPSGRYEITCYIS